MPAMATRPTFNGRFERADPDPWGNEGRVTYLTAQILPLGAGAFNSDNRVPVKDRRTGRRWQPGELHDEPKALLTICWASFTREFKCASSLKLSA